MDTLLHSRPRMWWMPSLRHSTIYIHIHAKVFGWTQNDPAGSRGWWGGVTDSFSCEQITAVFKNVVVTFYFFCFLTPLDAWMWLKRNGQIRHIWCIFFFEATRFMHSQHACDNNSPCIPLYKSLWKAGAGPDQRANPEENFSRVWAVPRCGQLPSIHENNRLFK